jgi:hypothetical protein
MCQFARTCAVLCSFVLAAATVDNDMAPLLDGVIAAKLGLAGPIAVVGPDAVALLAGGRDGAHEVTAVASRMGRGRVVAFGHNSALNNDEFLNGGTSRVVLNAVRWVAGKRPMIAIGVKGAGGIQKLLTREKIPFTVLGGTWSQELPKLHLLIAENGEFTDVANATATTEFLKAGGGLITAGTAWGWAQGNRGKEIRDDFPLNRLLAPAGLAFGDGTVDEPEAGFVPATEPLLHAVHALDQLAGALDDKQRPQATASVLTAVRSLMPDDKFLLPKLAKLAAGRPPVIPTDKQPLTEKKHGLERVLVAYDDQRLRALEPKAQKAHPAASDFPGAVPAEAKRVERTVTIDLNVPDWHSTGLYAAPGALITVTLPAEVTTKKLVVRIGAHTDGLWHKDSWSRWPALSWTRSLDQVTTTFANPFGGAVYVVVPRGVGMERVPVKIAGAVEAPLFVLGSTTVEQWKQIRSAPGPWAELQARRVILTVPSSVVRELADPSAVLAFWDEAIDAQDRLAAWGPEEMRRPERFVCDRQISAGYMHSGYPIMAHMDVADDNVELKLLKGNVLSPGGWGQWHELGHNHQHGWWTPGNQGEVTVNLFSLRVQQELYGCKPEHVWGGNLAPKKRTAAITAFRADNSKKPATWDPATGLVFYWQLIDGHGWDVLHRVIASYKTTPPNSEPKNDAQKWDEWLKRYSVEAKRDLGPFFTYWRMPVSDAALSEAAQQGPTWLHADLGG